MLVKGRARTKQSHEFECKLSARASRSTSLSTIRSKGLVDPGMARSAGVLVVECASEWVEAGAVVQIKMYGMLVETKATLEMTKM